MSNEGFDFKKLISDSIDTLTKPKEYFESMKTTGGLVEPIIKAVIYGAVAGLLYFIWGLLHLGVGGALIGGAVGFMAFIWVLIGSIIGLFIGAVVILVLSAIAKGNIDFEACTRVTASIMVLMPVSALLSFLSALSFKLFSVISLLINLYGLWLLFNGLVYSLKANKKTSQIILLVLVGIIVLFMLAGLGTKRATDRYMKNLDKESREMLKDFGIN
ncbi:MAG: Yip1 family protein [Bacteroidales bacterium]|jgi:hypothetical protein|nr:Yip1 family protein [Bacteroidales bacterium]